MVLCSWMLIKQTRINSNCWFDASGFFSFFPRPFYFAIRKIVAFWNNFPIYKITRKIKLLLLSSPFRQLQSQFTSIVNKSKPINFHCLPCVFRFGSKPFPIWIYMCTYSVWWKIWAANEKKILVDVGYFCSGWKLIWTLAFALALFFSFWLKQTILCCASVKIGTHGDSKIREWENACVRVWANNI